MLVAAGCMQTRPLPPLPDVSTAGFLPVVRHAVDAALADAKAKPNDAAASGRLGMVLHAYDQLAAARAAYRRASILDPQRFDWLYYEGAASTGAEAVEPLRRALKLRDYLPAKLKLAEALLATGDAAGAAAAVQGLDHPAAWFLYGRAASDPSFYEKAVAAFPQYGAAIFALAQHYQRSGRAAEAARLMAEYPRWKTVTPPVDDPLMEAVWALNQGPTSLLRRAMSLERAGRLEEAARLNEEALALDPQMIQAHTNLVSAYGRLGRFDDAEKHYRAAVALNPSEADAHYNFGVLCFQRGRTREAKAAFEAALKADPNHAGSHNNLGAILQQQGKLREAQGHFERAVALDSGLRLARFHLGRIYANQRRYAEAIAQFREITQTDDEATPTYLYALGAAYARSGDSVQAREVLRTARERAQARGQTELAASISRDLARLQ
jgi:tetratricopeptide (TPR) repeat protein